MTVTDPAPAPRETLLPLDTLLRLPERGANGLKDILRMAARGDWRTRALCVSAAGRIASAEPFARRLWRWFARRVPTWRRRFPSAGYRGKYVKNDIANALVDRSWAVRVAAALALGECRAPSKVENLRRLLTAPYRAERIAAAAALVCCGEIVKPAGSSLLDGAWPAPARIGDATRTIDFLATLASCHIDVLGAWLRIESEERPAGTTPVQWAAFLAGPVPEETYDGPDAEIERYDADGETEYLLTKPFSRINRAQNVRLLHSFLVASEHLRVPPDGRILDLGGGSAWVSELLAKLGYRPFTLDLSSGLLSVGKRRFAREGLTPRFMVGDMTRLPVATGSMQAVIVMDALHHVPDVPAVFREAYRVLAQGGQFLLAEPGEGHSETEKSRGEMLEYGVQEREIHFFEAIGYGRDVGFDDIRAVPHYVPGISMTSEDVKNAMKSSADEWLVHQDDRPGHFSQFLLQSMLDRPIIVFGKGRRPVDSRMPRNLKAEITPRLLREGSRVSGTVMVRNLGDTIWLGGGEAAGDVRLGVQLLTAERRLIDMEFSRCRLSTHVAPGAALEIAVALTLPDPQRSFVLKLDLVDEGICWFEDGGSRPVYLAV